MSKKVTKPTKDQIIWSLVSSRDQRGLTLILGITESGVAFLKSGPASLDDAPILTVTPTDALHVTEVVVMYGKDMATLERILTENGFLVEDDES